MKFFIRLLLFTLLLVSYQLSADEGDTLIVQTIDWDTPTLPGWNSPRSGVYQFPGDTISFSKILMYYTLKCDPSQNPACGEWDYITYTRVQEHTGELDSTTYTHPNYMVNNASPDSFAYMYDTSWRYMAWMEYSNQTEADISAEVGDAGETLIWEEDGSGPDGRMQHLYKASELLDAGLEAGDITSVYYNFGESKIDFTHFRIRIQNTSLDKLPPNLFVDEGFETVVHDNRSFDPGPQRVDFAFPFTWDGTSNILVDISFETHDGAVVMVADPASSNTSYFASLNDYHLDFGGWDYIDVPAEVFETIDSAITISFWQYGDPDIQPANSSIIEGIDSEGHRLLNIHLPWGNEIVYWDAGWNGNYDRLTLLNSDPSTYEGQWNHWAFTKDIETGLMLVYLNGELWNIGGGFYRPMSGITEFRIGAALTYNGYYDGMIDEFRIWDKALDEATIKAWRYRSVNSSHPDYDHLRAYYSFNEGSGTQAEDNSPNGFDGTQFGFPAWKNYHGAERFLGALELNVRPHATFESGEYDPHTLDSLVRVDTMAKPAVNIVLFDPADPPAPTDTLTAWPAYYNNYVFNEFGMAVDSTLVAPDSIIYHEDMIYYGDPYEVVIPWEIARYITPYGIGLDLGEGWTWVFDVTDYAPLLRDSVHLTAGNFQELLDLKFYMIEGTPPREVKKIEKIYSGSFALNNFETLVPPDTIALLPDASTFKVKTRTSGHQFDNSTNCAEFCYKVHYLDVEGENVFNWQIIEECSNNALYPQGGTWIYDRAGWCPGAKVTEHDVEITPYVTGDTVVIDYNSDPDPYGNYVLEVQLFSYGNPNFTTDAAVVDVIRPTDHELSGRFNPSISAPIVVIQNLGGDTLTSLDIVYGPEGSSHFHAWNGALGFMQKETVVLETFDWTAWEEGDGHFKVSLENPNGITDENGINNTYHTQYSLPAVYPGTFVIHFKTNKTPSQNSYQIFDMEGNVVFEKGDFEAQTLYVDTVTLLNGIYDFYLWDTGDNGISFWANSEGSGYLRIYDMEGEMIRSFEPDFGDNVYHNFYMDMFTATPEDISGEMTFELLPNPNQGNFTSSYALRKAGEMNISVTNVSGQQVYTSKRNGELQGKVRMNLEELPPGLYSCEMESDNHRLVKKFIIK
ncbi:MAG: peptide-N-glycosidase F-related protein [bacterium]